MVKGMRTNAIGEFPGNYVLRWKIDQQRVEFRVLRARGGLISGHHRKTFQQDFYSSLGIEASGQGWGNKSGQREKEVWERVKGVELLGSSAVWIWSGSNVGGKRTGGLAWTAWWRVPVADMGSQRMRCLGNQGREESEFMFGNTAFCRCCCWRNVQENLSSWELKSPECWEEDLHFRVSRIYLIHKWMSEFRGARSSERKSRPRTKAELLLTRGPQSKSPRRGQRRSELQRRASTLSRLAAPWEVSTHRSQRLFDLTRNLSKLRYGWEMGIDQEKQIYFQGIAELIPNCWQRLSCLRLWFRLRKTRAWLGV